MWHCRWHWFQTKLIVHFLPHFNGIKFVTSSKCILEETGSKLVIKIEYVNFQDSHKYQYPAPVCFFFFFCLHEPPYSDICCSKLPLTFHMFHIGNTNTYLLCNDTIHALVVCLEPMSMCWCRNIIKWHHHCTGIFMRSCCWRQTSLVIRGVTGIFFWGGKVTFPDFFSRCEMLFPGRKFPFW